MQALSLLSSGGTAFQTVFMFSHRDRAAVSEFVTLRTSSGHSLSASPGHYLWVKPAERQQGSFWMRLPGGFGKCLQVGCQAAISKP